MCGLLQLRQFMHVILPLTCPAAIVTFRFFFFFKGLAQLALCHVLDQKLYDIGWFSHRRRNSTCGRRSLNTGANVSSSAVGSTLCLSLLFPSLLFFYLLFSSGPSHFAEITRFHGNPQALRLLWTLA